VLLLRLVNPNNIVFHFHDAAGELASCVFAQFLDREVVGTTVEPPGVVNQQDMIPNPVPVDGFQLLLDGRGIVAPMGV